jgi:uncharacterized membrane protein
MSRESEQIAAMKTMTVTEAAEEIAQSFHSVYEKLAPRFGYETKEASRTAWSQVPEKNRTLMIATVQRLLDTRVIVPGDAQEIADEIFTPVASTDYLEAEDRIDDLVFGDDAE